MKTVHKLILKSYAGPMVLTFFIVLFVFIMQFMWRYIDELVGKGLGMDVILELMMYAAVTLIPMVLPLATLFAAVMTMGNMGENYELLALKSAGISLPKIMRPLIILVLFVAVGSFFVANNLVPIATKKISALLYDIRQQKQSIEFKDGLFFNGMDDISIRVDRQDPENETSERRADLRHERSERQYDHDAGRLGLHLPVGRQEVSAGHPVQRRALRAGERLQMVRQQRTAPKYLRRVQHGDEGARLRLRANRPVDVQRQPNQERQGTSGRNRLARENQLRVGQRLVRNRCSIRSSSLSTKA